MQDPDRCGILPFVFDDDFGFARYAEFALDVPMYFVSRCAFALLVLHASRAAAPAVREDTPPSLCFASCALLLSKWKTNICLYISSLYSCILASAQEAARLQHHVRLKWWPNPRHLLCCREGRYISAAGQSFRDFMEGNLPALPGQQPNANSMTSCCSANADL
jgi:Glutamate-cysteine ligase family 2(GCS2)